MAPLVTAIVPSYNYARSVCNAVDSLLAQTFEDLEIVVVENASTDGSRELLEGRFGQDPRVRLFLETEHLSMSGNFNRALRYARGRYVGLCAADDRWYPHHLATVVPALQAAPQASLVYSRADIVDGEGKPLPPMFDIEPDDGHFFERLLLHGIFVPAMTVVFDRELALARGGFCEDMPIGMDLDMWLKLSVDREVRHVDQVTIAVSIHGGNASAKSKLVAERMRRDRCGSYRMLLAKHLPALEARGLVRKTERRLADQLASLARRTADKEEARRCYRDALALEPWRVWWYFGLLRASLGA
jgi:glycosyltransferase involved in cell wall biosynthesis